MDYDKRVEGYARDNDVDLETARRELAELDRHLAEMDDYDPQPEENFWDDRTTPMRNG